MSCCLSFICKNRRKGAKKLFKKSTSELAAAAESAPLAASRSGDQASLSTSTKREERIFLKVLQSRDRLDAPLPPQIEAPPAAAEEDGPLLVCAPPQISPSNREERIFLKVLQNRERSDFVLPPKNKGLALDDDELSTPKSPTSYTEDSPRKVQECMKTMFGRRISHMDAKIENILKRYPDKTREEVAAALVQNNGHAGSACQDLRLHGTSPLASTLGASSRIALGKEETQDRFGGSSESTLAQSPLTSTASETTPFQAEEVGSKIANLLRRFPHKSRDQVEEALERCDGHAGQVSILFSREAGHGPRK